MDRQELVTNFRTWMNEGWGKWICGAAAAGLILLACGIFLGGDDSADRADRIRQAGMETMYLCGKCTKSGTVRLVFDGDGPMDFAGRFPIDCPQCKAPKAAVLAVTCSGCDKPMPHSDRPVYYCPHTDCGKKYDNTLSRE
ncbi:MAG: hypothetical protein ACYS5V_16310 [Planctomycetota bacterium]|jgi:hypothetical protein